MESWRLAPVAIPGSLTSAPTSPSAKAGTGDRIAFTYLSTAFNRLAHYGA
jgi:hypothetical protein